MAKNKLISMECVRVGEWLIKPSQMFGRILVSMFNLETDEYILHCVRDSKEANLLIEYIIEKGGFND